MDRSGAVSRGAQGAERGELWEGSEEEPDPHGGDWEGAIPSPEMFLLFDLIMEHFGAVFKLDLTEETKTQLQEGEIASYWLRLWL